MLSVVSEADLLWLLTATRSRWLVVVKQDVVHASLLGGSE